MKKENKGNILLSILIGAFLLCAIVGRNSLIIILARSGFILPKTVYGI